MVNISKYELPATKLRWHCDPKIFDFECTEDLAPLKEFIGQDRAIGAIDFGLSMNHDGYNIYVAGLTGTGKTSAVKTHIDKLLKEKQSSEQLKPPQDWCYLYNFADSDRPKIINLPQGKGKVFRTQIAGLLQKLKEELAKAFSSEEYKTERKAIIEAAQEERQKLSAAMREEARHQGFAIQVTPSGQAIIPLVNGKPVSEEDYMALEEAAKKEMDAKRNDLLKKLQAAYEKVRDLERKTEDKLRDTDKSVAGFTIARLFDSLIQEYKDSENVRQFLLDLQSHTLDNLELFKEKEAQAEPTLDITASYLMQGRDPFLPFQVNALVDNSETKGPPVIAESNPTYINLFGRIERRFLFGGYLSDHSMLKPGAFHLANGGYLLLNATDVLNSAGVWQALKRTIKTKEVRIEDPLEGLGLIAPQGLRPQPMPVDVKVLLIGDGMVYQLLTLYDEDFWEIFKVKADFDSQIARTKENMFHFAAFIAGCCEKCEIHHFDKTGVAKVVEYASRIVGDQEKLSSRFAIIRELVQEAEYWSRKDKATLVSAQHVEKAVEERFFRHNLPYERIKEMIERGIIMIDVKNAFVGQVNGLSVYSLGDVAFGKPSRITCKTFLGRGGVINIERESQLSGKIHDKGVLILSGYLGWKYAQDNPLALSASLCFEQSYDGVEGDSASSTELYALISSLADVPIKQNIAVTGSVNQKGEIQAIGGVNQKIEGFFHICKTKGLNGDQGVMIPRQNVTNLMLRQEIIDAVKEGKFHIYAVSTIDEGLEVLTDVPAGKKRKDGTYLKDSINYKVDKQLKEMANKLRRFSEPEAKNKKKNNSSAK
jgi:lon-related putative ATP-dependent protease